MERLLRDAERMAGYIEGSLDIESFADIADAIHIVQEEMGITGTTALEAGRTISGSVGAMKSAWTNLVTGFADGNADIESLIEDLVGTIVGDGTENNLGFIGNVLPAIETALGGVVKLIEGAAPKIIEILPGLVAQIVPSLISAATSLVGSLVAVFPSLLQSVLTALTNQSSQIIQTVLDVFLDVGKSLVENAPLLIDAITQIIDELIWWVGEYSYVFGETAVDLIEALTSGIVSNLPMLIETALVTIEYFAETLTEMFPQIVSLGLDLILSLANGIADSLPELIPTIMDVILQIVDTLTDPSNLTNLLNAALTIIAELAYGLMDAIPQLVQAVSDIIINIADFLVDPVNLANILKAAVDVVIALAVGLVDAIPVLLKHLPKLWLSIIDNFRNVDWGQLGKNLVDGFKNGLSRAWTSLKTWFKNLFGDLIGIAKKILGIASPSKVFKKIGGFTAEGFGAGFEDEFAKVKNDMEDALNFDDASVGINASIRKVGAGAAVGAFGGTSIGNININIDGAKYTDEQSLASAIALEIQNMTDRRAAVYA